MNFEKEFCQFLMHTTTDPNFDGYFFNYEYTIYFFRNPYILEVSGLSKCGESHFVLFKLQKFHDTNKKVTNERY